jgi:competence ComEA-like helix-hairpin-helix protein
MRLLVAAISFAVTLGAILAVDKLGSPKNPADEMAAILASAQKTQEIQLSPTSTPKTVKKMSAGAATAAPASPVSTISPTPIPSSIAGADETTNTPITSMLVSATPVPTTATPAPTATPLATPSPTPTPTANQSGLININTAGLTELYKITGIGPVLAQKIIDYRNANGPFQKIEDIINVSGIGPKTFERMKDEITI